MRIVVATKNEGKVKEIKSIFNDMDVDIFSMNELNINVNIVEDGNSFKENALIKARKIVKYCNEITIADDSGLVVDYLNGLPGIYSARYAGENASDNDRINKLLKELSGIEFKKRTARFICAIALAFPDGTEYIVEGKCEGIIDYELKGNKGFGYDPIFYLPEYDKTMAQIDSVLKNKISHRAVAMKLLKEKLEKI